MTARVKVLELCTSTLVQYHMNLLKLYELLLEIDRYIGLPIFFPIFKHFTIIGFVKK